MLIVHSCNLSHRELCHCAASGVGSGEQEPRQMDTQNRQRAVPLLLGSLIPCPQNSHSASPPLGRGGEGSRWCSARQQTEPYQPPEHIGMNSSISHQPFNPVLKTEKWDQSLNNKEEAGYHVDLAFRGPLKIKAWVLFKSWRNLQGS